MENEYENDEEQNDGAYGNDAEKKVLTRRELPDRNRTEPERLTSLK